VRKAQQTGTRSGRPIGRPRALAYPVDLLKLMQQGHGLKACATKLGVSEATCRRIIRRKPEVFKGVA
jgi:DNA invertase Pin-like site-specific DNA recombinase